MIPAVRISDYRTELSLLSGQVGGWVVAVMCLGRGIKAQKSLIQSILRHPIDMKIRMNNFLNIRSVLAFLGSGPEGDKVL